jgi:DNA polymerase III alpha subunit
MSLRFFMLAAEFAADGFYSPSQLLQDARRHDVQVRAVDVMHSNWDSSLEPDMHFNRYTKRRNLWCVWGCPC